MFTGIIQACIPITAVKRKPGLVAFTVRLPKNLRGRLKRGASVAIDGVCLTAINLKKNAVSFEVMRETLDKTTLNGVRVGRKVNIERSAHFSDEIGGHLVSGHVTGTAAIIAVDRPKNNCAVTFRAPKAFVRYVFPKGFIALDGASLTVVDVNRKKAEFTVHLIPETLRVTTFGFKKIGDRVNLEIDSRTQIIADTASAMLGSRFTKLRIPPAASPS